MADLAKYIESCWHNVDSLSFVIVRVTEVSDIRLSSWGDCSVSVSLDVWQLGLVEFVIRSYDLIDPSSLPFSSHWRDHIMLLMHSSSSISYLCLHHCRSLSSECLYGLEEVDHSLVPHPLQDDAQGDEYTSPSNTSTDQHAQWQTLVTNYHIHYISFFETTSCGPRTGSMFGNMYIVLYS